MPVSHGCGGVTDVSLCISRTGVSRDASTGQHTCHVSAAGLTDVTVHKSLSLGSLHLLGDLWFFWVALGLGRHPGRLSRGLSGSAPAAPWDPTLLSVFRVGCLPSGPHTCYP